jgi:hypothetical protein
VQTAITIAKIRNRSAVARDYFSAEFFANCELREICDFSYFAICDFLFSAICEQFVICANLKIRKLTNHKLQKNRKLRSNRKLRTVAQSQTFFGRIRNRSAIANDLKARNQFSQKIYIPGCAPS